ncbi:MAG TPA: STAS domain-containing protein [Terriglobales bacterium]|nr:STAS domain-containing protein [Terriglobales bacterium]
MATNAAWLERNTTSVTHMLQDAVQKLDDAENELVLDFSSITRIDASALKVLEELATKAEAKHVSLVLRNPNVNVYKVLKLMRLSHRFSVQP